MRVSRRECVNRLGRMKSFAEIPRVQKKRCFYYYQELAADFSFLLRLTGFAFGLLRACRMLGIGGGVIG